MTADDVAAMRRDARAIFDAALDAVEPAALVRSALLNSHELRGSQPVHVLAAGKAACPMALAAIDVLGVRVQQSIVVATADAIAAAQPALQATGVRVIAGGHPLPDEGSSAAGDAALDMVAGTATANAVLLVLLSGGASALLVRPATGISLSDYRDTTQLLLDAGASIDELNCVRRHIDDLKGGGLAAAAAPAPVLAFVISDVVGNRMEVIASGPMSTDPTTPADALRVIERHELTTRVPPAIRRHLESGVTARAPLPDVHVRIIADNDTALRAAVACATRLGYAVTREAEPVTGDAAAAGTEFGARLRALPAHGCLLAGGETTVRVRGSGAGGRNQELALAAALAIEGDSGCVILAGGTDGVDGATAAAGAIVDGGTVGRLRDVAIDPVAVLADNDSNRALAASGDLLITGPTGTNVMDVLIGLRLAAPLQ